LTVLELIDLIRDLATRHPEIKGFYTGTEAQHDDSVLQYPAVRVVFPYSITQKLDTNSMTLSLTVTVMVNEARQAYPDPNININYATENSLVSENSQLYGENDMRDNAARLANHLIRFMQLSAKDLRTFEVLRADIRGVERGHADFLTGVNILFDFYLGNPYICEANEIFENLGGSACDRLLATLSDSAKINCILKSYNFASAAVQNALTTQQKYDIKYWALPQYDFTDSVWLDRLTDTQEDDLSIALLPFIDFSDPAIQALLTSQQKTDLIAYLFQFIDFSDSAIQALASVQQKQDMADWVCTPVAPPVQYSMLFDGANEAVACSNNSAHDFERTDSFTISLWIYPTSLTGVRAIISKRNNLGAGWAIGTNGSSLTFQLINTVNTNQISVSNISALALNAWNHVVVTYNGSSAASGVITYVNSILQVNTVVANNLSASTQSSAVMYLGRNSATGSVYYSGYMGIARIWNTVLSVGDIASDYNGGTMNNATVNPASNVFDWRAGTDALYSGAWVFPDVSGTLIQTSPVSVNAEYTDITNMIP